MVSNQKISIAHLFDSDAPQHLAHNDFNVLVVDSNTLQTVNLLYFINQIFGQGLLAQNIEDIVRVRRAVHKSFSSPDTVPFVNADVFTFGNEILSRLTDFRRHDNLPFAFGILAERNHSVDFTDHGKFLRLARLEELRHSGKSSRDIFGLGGFSRYLRQDVARVDRLTILNVDMGTHRQEIARFGGCRQTSRLPLDIFNRDSRPFVNVLGIDDHFRRQPGPLIDFFFHRYSFNNVAELDDTSHFCENRNGVRIPLGQQFPGFDLGAVLFLKFRTVNDGVTLPFSLSPFLTFRIIHDGDFTVAVHHHEIAFFIGYRAHIDKLHGAVVSRFQRGLLGSATRGPTDMESPHSELGSRLTDGLRGNDPDRFPKIDHVASTEIATIAKDTNTALRLTRQHGPDLDSFYSRLLDTLNQFFIDFLVGLNYDLSCKRIFHVFERDPTQNTISQGFDDLSAFHEWGDFDTIHSAAIVLADDGILSHIDEPAG